jgi:hypothetical protein
LLTTAPTGQAVPREVIAEYWQRVVLADPPRRPKPRPAPRITEWTLIRARIDAWATARRIRDERSIAQGEAARHAQP